MIKALIIEDEVLAGESLEYLLKKYCSAVKITGIASSFREAYDLFSEKRPDLLFVDVMLNSPEGNGIDLAHMPGIENCAVIFVSGHREFAADAFRLKAVDYLLKPVQINQLIEAVEKATVFINKTRKAQERKAKPARGQFHIPVKNSFVIVKHKDIIRCEADGAYTHFIVNGSADKITSSVNLGQMETKLGDDFLRVHKSHIINKNFISAYTKSEGLIVVMSDKAQIPVSRAMRDAFFDWLG